MGALIGIGAPIKDGRLCDCTPRIFDLKLLLFIYRYKERLETDGLTAKNFRLEFYF